MGVRRVMAGFLMTAGLLTATTLGAAPAALAADPVDLGSAHVVDHAGVLSPAEKRKVEAAAAGLYQSHKLDLFVVFVDRFTNPTDAEDWANETAARNNLGPSDYLLAVATDGRAYYLSGDSSGPVRDSELDSIERNDVEPRLHAGDWSGAAVAAANGLGDAVGGGGGAVFFWVFLVGVLVVAAAFVLVVRSRRRTRSAVRRAPQSELQTIPLADLERRAGSALVQTDDAIRTSEEELGFATAQYGTEAVVPFKAALDGAKAQLTEAFRLKQKLDDSEPDTDEQRREWNIRIVQLCASANEALDKQADAFDELRDLEKDIPGAGARIAAETATIAARQQQAETALTALAQRYSDGALATVADNVPQSRQRLAFAGTALEAATQKAGAGETGSAAVGIRAAEEAVDQAGLLLDAVDRLGADLARTQQRIDATIPELESDLAEARAIAAAGDPDGGIAGAIAGTEQTLADVKARIAAGRIDPLELAARLDAANRTIDDVLQGVRDARAQQQRAASALQQTVIAARARISACQDFITARRGAVGIEARTRLAEAARLVAEAEQTATGDPVGSLARAQRAALLADQATQLAQRDVGGFQPRTGDLGGMFGGGTSGGAGGAVGAILGGILIGSVLGGGGGRSRGGGGGGGSWSGGGGFGPGSFGGGGTRARRGGGRF